MSKGKFLYYVLIGILLVIFFVKGCGSSSSCSCLSPIPGGQPPDMGFKSEKKLPNAVQARLSSSAISFLSTRLPDILKVFLAEQTSGEGLTFPIPYTKTTSNGCDVEICTNGNCSATLTINSVRMNLVAPNTIDLTINVDLKTTQIGVHAGYKVIWCIYADCDISADIKNKDIKAQINLFDDPFTDFMTFDLPADKIDIKIEPKDININGGLLCDIADWDFIKGLIIKQIDIKKQLSDQLPPMIAQNTCEACGGQGDPPCPAGSTCTRYNGGDYCVAASTNRCVAKPLGTIGRMDLSETLKDFAPGLSAYMDLYVVAGDYPPYPPKVRDDGLDIQVIGGTDAERNMCVPETEPPKLEGDAIPLLMLANTASICEGCDPQSPLCPADAVCSDKYTICITDEANGVCPVVPFMVGIGINEYFLRKLFWDAFNSGLLCLNIDSATVPQLTSGVLSMLLPSLNDLTDGKNTSVLISIRPTKSPDVKIGRGLLRVNGDKKEIFRPIILLTIPQLSIDFYAVVFDRYTRILTLTADLEVPLALDVVEIEKPDPSDPNKTLKVVEIVPVLGDLTNGIKNIVVSNSELLAERPEDIAKQLTSLIGTLIGPLMGGAGLSGFEIPDLQGFILKIKSIAGEVPYTSINDPSCNDFDESAPGCYYKFLNIYADLDLVAPQSPPPTPPPEITIKKIIPGYILFTNKSPEYEYSFRINGGLWSLFMSGSEIALPAGETAFEGRYPIEIRYRKRGSDVTTMYKAQLIAVADFTPPDIDVYKNDDRLIFRVKDGLTPRERIRVEYSMDGISFSTVEGDSIEVVENVKEIFIKATDEASNSNLVKMNLSELSSPPVDISTPVKDERISIETGCSCSLVE